MGFLTLFAAVFFLILIVGAIWTHLAQASLREMNAGARLYREKRYADAEAHFRQLLERRLPPGVEADTRRRLADTLDILGKPQEATSERAQIEAIVAANPKEARAQQAWGDLLKNKHQYDAACEAYIYALAGTPHSNRPERATIMAKLAHANYDAGRPEETVRWAACSLASFPSPNIRRSMERMSGIGSSDLGDLEKAEQHYRNSLHLSNLSDSAEQVAQDLGILAGVHFKRGQFQEAIAACHQARQMFEGSLSTTACTIEAECLREMGRFEEARAVMAQFRSMPKFDQPKLVHRMEALGALGCAWIEVRADQPEAALAFLEQARAGFAAAPGTGEAWPPAPQKGDDKLLLWCDATKSLALAQRGDTDASRMLRESVLSRLNFFDEDRNTCLLTYSSLGRAAFVLGDLTDCQNLLQQYFDCWPYAPGLLSANYWLGETYLRLGETEAACEAFREAIAPGIDSLDAQRASARLDEIG